MARTKTLTVKELIKELEKQVKAGMGDSIVTVEGCDCTRSAIGTKVIDWSSTQKAVFITTKD